MQGNACAYMYIYICIYMYIYIERERERERALQGPGPCLTAYQNSLPESDPSPCLFLSLSLPLYTADVAAIKKVHLKVVIFRFVSLLS